MIALIDCLALPCRADGRAFPRGRRRSRAALHGRDSARRRRPDVHSSVPGLGPPRHVHTQPAEAAVQHGGGLRVVPDQRGRLPEKRGQGPRVRLARGAVEVLRL